MFYGEVTDEGIKRLKGQVELKGNYKENVHWFIIVMAELYYNAALQGTGTFDMTERTEHDSGECEVCEKGRRDVLSDVCIGVRNTASAEFNDWKMARSEPISEQLTTQPYASY